MFQIDFPLVVGSDAYLEIKASRDNFTNEDSFILYENNMVMCKWYSFINYNTFIVNSSQSGESDTKIKINHKSGQEKSVKIVFIKQSADA